MTEKLIKQKSFTRIILQIVYLSLQSFIVFICEVKKDQVTTYKEF